MVWDLRPLSAEGVERGDIWAECAHSQLLSSEPIRSRDRAFIVWLVMPSLAVVNITVTTGATLEQQLTKCGWAEN